MFGGDPEAESDDAEGGDGGDGDADGGDALAGNIGVQVVSNDADVDADDDGDLGLIQDNEAQLEQGGNDAEGGAAHGHRR